jgi:phage terminase small subunit
MTLRAVPKTTKADPEPVPADLGAAGGELWARLTTDYRLEDEAGRAVLSVACRAADRAESCRLAVAKAGLVVKDRFRQTRPHPLLAVERAARAQLLHALRQLQLPIPAD